MELARQARARRRGLGPASLVFAVLVNAVLFGILALVNRPVQVDAPRASPDPIEVYLRPPPIAELPADPALDEPMPEPELLEVELLEPLQVRTELAAPTPRIPPPVPGAFDPLGIQIEVSDVEVEAPAQSEWPMELPAVDPPRRTFGAMPPYPEWALSEELVASLRVEFVVDVDGSVTDVRCTELDGDERFKEMAVAAVRKWRFEPATYRGQSVPVRCFKRFSYKLED